MTAAAHAEPNDKLSPIPTSYSGVRFRSRLEARWAVFFDLLEVPWMYEPEGYALEHGLYLPDFSIKLKRPGGTEESFFEVKPKRPTEAEQNLISDLAQESGKVVYVGIGPPSNDEPTGGDCHIEINGGHWMDEDGRLIASWDSPYYFCLCPKCQAIGITFDGRGARVCGSRCCQDSDKDYTADRLSAHAARARRWSFWSPA